jgi:hypothetical protein
MIANARFIIFVGIRVSAIETGLSHFNLVLCGLWETVLIRRCMQLEDFQLVSPKDDCMEYFQEIVRYLRYGSQEENDEGKFTMSRKYESFLETLSDFSSEVIINMNLKTIALSNLDIFVLLINIIRLLIGLTPLSTEADCVVNPTWKELFPDEVLKGNLSKNGEVMKSLKSIVYNRMKIIDKILEVCFAFLIIRFLLLLQSTHAILFGSELVQNNALLSGKDGYIDLNLCTLLFIGFCFNDRLLDISVWTSVLVCNYYTVICELFGIDTDEGGLLASGLGVLENSVQQRMSSFPDDNSSVSEEGNIDLTEECRTGMLQKGFVSLFGHLFL